MGDEKDYDYYEEELKYIRNGKENIIESWKNQLYNKLLSKIFDDSINIDQFKAISEK